MQGCSARRRTVTALGFRCLVNLGLHAGPYAHERRELSCTHPAHLEPSRHLDEASHVTGTPGALWRAIPGGC